MVVLLALQARSLLPAISLLEADDLVGCILYERFRADDHLLYALPYGQIGVDPVDLAPQQFLDSGRLRKLLSEIADSDIVNPLVSGFACALLAEKGEISPDKLSELVSRRLSKGTPPAEGAAWFEGLARRNRRSLIGRLTLWEKLCGFIRGLDDEEFKPVLIALRRTFAEFTPAEKNDIAENIGEVLGISSQQAAEIITAEVTAEEQQTIDELDDFDFGDI